MKPLFKASTTRWKKRSHPSLAIAQMAKAATRTKAMPQFRARWEPNRSSAPYVSLMASLAFSVSSPVATSLLSVSQVGAPHGLVLAKLVGGARQRDLSRLQHIGPIRDVEGEVGVLFHQQHGDALFAVQLTEAAEEILHDDGREAERRLVEQQQARPAHQRPSDRQHLLLATAQASRQLRAPLGQAGEDL